MKTVRQIPREGYIKSKVSDKPYKSVRQPKKSKTSQKNSKGGVHEIKSALKES